ncbi:MAG: hypothetical protein SFW36_20570 [Leptolyngbyaceae cyanobacterium bins.59]|nr:hypothetical protein [Leptolyngbyaceae cyanobacterium bins.59]
MTDPSQDPESYLTPSELAQWHLSLEEANRHNVLCHCRKCDREWVASDRENCQCGSSEVESILCWQFPDD